MKFLDKFIQDAIRQKEESHDRELTDEDNYVVNMLPAKVSRYIVMKKSAVIDKNNNPIYESDIIQNSNGSKYKVRYDDKIGFYGMNEKKEYCTLDLLDKCEYIGSEYDS